LFAGIFLLYNILGTIYNQKKHRLYGPEAIPHIDKWRQLPSKLDYMLGNGLNKAMILLALARGFMQKKLNNYSSI